MKTRGGTERGTEALSLSVDSRLEPVHVEAVDGPGAGARALFTGGVFMVGSQDGCDLVVKDPSVSRRHALLELHPGRVRVRDQGSKNGTVYLGAKVKEADVPVGGSIRLGKTTLTFAPASAPARASARHGFGKLLGQSLPMRQLFAELEKLASTRTSVLIVGETGSGKEAAARALHDESPQAKEPFITFDCAAAVGELVESELFGHRKGAFTGADADRTGALQRTGSGTLFFANVDELPLQLQPKLLRALEAREFLPVGADEPRQFAGRVLSSTRKNLEEEGRSGRFRADLFFRLAGAMVVVPPLRDRVEDVPLLANHFAKEIAGAEVRFSPATMAALRSERWPGNVRELRNAVERVVALGALPKQTKKAPERVHATYKETRAQLLDKFERDFVATLLQDHKGNVTRAAKDAGISRMQFYRLIKRHGLMPEP